MSLSPKDWIKGIFISRSDGTFLVSVVFDENLNTKLLSAFIGGLQMFGKESIGNIDEIIIKGLDLEVLVVSKHELILTAIFRNDMFKENLKGQAEMALDAFYNSCKLSLDSGSNCLDDYEKFEKIIEEHIKQYFEMVRNKQIQSNFWSIILDRVGKNFKKEE
jgi:hypothetical protein